METQELYREILNEHNINPSHKSELKDANLVLNGINPSCGDNITLNLKVENGILINYTKYPDEITDNVSVPETVVKIAEYTFFHCKNLKT